MKYGKTFENIEEPKFNTPTELLDFVLEDCGDMEYHFSYSGIGEPTTLSQKELGYKLVIKKNFDMEKIFYAIKFLEENFDNIVKVLTINNLDIYEIPEGYLVYTKVDEFTCRNNGRLKKLPKLPQTVEYLDITGTDIETFEECGIDTRKLKYFNFQETPLWYNSKGNRHWL